MAFKAAPDVVSAVCSSCARRIERVRGSRPRDWPGPSFGYEALNLVDGERTVGEIRDALAATVGDAPVEEVDEYLATLARLGVLEATPP